MTTGRPGPLRTAWRLEFNPPLVRQMAPAKRPLSSRLAVVRCAFRWMLSKISRSGSLASLAGASKMRLNTPVRLQRTKRL
jgi:hypothetical protein